MSQQNVCNESRPSSLANPLSRRERERPRPGQLTRCSSISGGHRLAPRGARAMLRERFLPS